MAYTPIAGPIAILKVGSTIAPGVSWKVTIDGKLANTSNFRDGRATAQTLPDADLSFTLVWDGATPPTDTTGLNLRNGTVFTAQLYTDSTHFFSGSFQVGTVDPGIDSLESVLMYPVTAKLQGTITYPINTL